MDTKTKRIGKVALFLGAGFLAGLASFWGKVFILPILIAVVIVFWPRFVGWMGISLISIGSGAGFGLIKSSVSGGFIAGGIIVFILILLMVFSIMWHEGKFKFKKQ